MEGVYAMPACARHTQNPVLFLYKAGLLKRKVENKYRVEKVENKYFSTPK